MTKQTIKSIIEDLIWEFIEAPIFERVLKRHGIELGPWYMDELINMYNKSKQ